MYAVIRTGGKQYRVSQDDVIRIEKIDAERGAEVNFEVLALGEGDNLQIGTPVIESASVQAKVLRQARDRKILVGKFRRRKNYRRKNGHRQAFTEIKISSIQA